MTTHASLTEDQPSYCSPEHLMPVLETHRPQIPVSKMFSAAEERELFEARHPGRTYFVGPGQGDGGASIDVIKVEDLDRANRRYLSRVGTTAYGLASGRADLRRAIFENYWRFDSDLNLDPNKNILICDGGRDALKKWYDALTFQSGRMGDNIVVSAAPWGSYLWGPVATGLNVMRAPGRASFAFRMTPEGIDACVKASMATGRRVAGLVITSPDNPTGSYFQESELLDLIEGALSCGVEHVLLDLMYQDVIEDTTPRYNMSRLLRAVSPQGRARISLLAGITKMAGASSLRNAHLVSTNPAITMTGTGLASNIVLPNGPGEAVALEIYDHEEPWAHPWVRRVVSCTNASRRLTQARLHAAGILHIADQGYYAFVNCERWLGTVTPEGQHINTVQELTRYLSIEHGIMVIHGMVFCQPQWFRFSLANTPEYTASALDRLFEGLDALRAP